MENTELILPFRVFDQRYLLGDKSPPLFASNEKAEACLAARDAGEGMVVVEVRRSRERIIYISPYKNDIGVKK